MIQHTIFRRFTTTRPRKEGQSLPPTRLRRRRTTTYRLIVITLVIIASYTFHVSRRESQDVQHMDWTSIKSGHSTSMVDVFSSSISAESTPYQTPSHAKRVEQQLALEPVPDTRRDSLHVHSLAHLSSASCPRYPTNYTLESCSGRSRALGWKNFGTLA
jgi:hypothetical protein